MKKCKSGYYYCNKDKKCKPIPKGYRIGYGGYLRHDNDDDTNGKKKNGNGKSNGSSNGNGNGGNGSGNGNGSSGGNGGGNGSGGMSEGSLHKWFKGSKSKDGKGGWVNVVTGGTCASDEPGEGTPKCVSSSKRASMTKAERLSAARRKKKADPGQQSKTGAAKPTYVSTDSPRKKKMKESYSDWRNEMELTEADKKGKGSGTKDACYHKVKASAKVWPSAYASGRLVQCRKKGAANYGNKSEEYEVTNADKKGNTPAYQGYKAGKKNKLTGKPLYKAAPHMKEGKEESGYISNAAKAEVRNQRRFGKKGSATPQGYFGQKPSEKAELAVKRGEEHKARRGVKTKGMKEEYYDWRSTLDEKCWKGYEKKGMKTMFGKRYPNCVKKEQVERDEYGDPIGGPKISKEQKKKNLAKNEPDKQHTTDTSEGMAYGITRGSGKPSGQMAAFGKKKEAKKENPYSLKNKLKMVIKSVAEKERAKAGVTKEDYHSGTGEKVVARTKKYMDKKGMKGAPGLDAMKARTAEHKAKRGVKEEVISERQKTNQGHRQSEEQHRSNYGKASVRNMRAFGKGGNAADPAERLVAMDARHKAHKEKRGVKTKGVKEEVGVTTSTMMDKAKKEAMLRKKEQDAVSKKMKKEETITLQDADGNDFVQIVDVISSKKVMSDWRSEFKEGAAWTKKSGKNPSGGLNEKGRKSYEQENPGSDLKAPSKKVGNPRRKSFCARMKGMKKKLTSKKTASDPDSRINKSLRAWNC